MASANFVTDAISKAVVLLRTSPDLDDEASYRVLVQQGISAQPAARLVEFLPMAYCRLLFAESGVRFTDTFLRKSPDGTLEEHVLSSEPIWRAVLDFGGAEIQRGISAQDILSIAGRSAELRAADDLLGQGSKLENITFTAPILNWPEHGPATT